MPAPPRATWSTGASPGKGPPARWPGAAGPARSQRWLQQLRFSRHPTPWISVRALSAQFIFRSSDVERTDDKEDCPVAWRRTSEAPSSTRGRRAPPSQGERSRTDVASAAAGSFAATCSDSGSQMRRSSVLTVCRVAARPGGSSALHAQLEKQSAPRFAATSSYNFSAVPIRSKVVVHRSSYAQACRRWKSKVERVSSEWENRKKHQLRHLIRRTGGTKQCGSATTNAASGRLNRRLRARPWRLPVVPQGCELAKQNRRPTPGSAVPGSLPQQGSSERYCEASHLRWRARGGARPRPPEAGEGKPGRRMREPGRRWSLQVRSFGETKSSADEISDASLRNSPAL